MSNSHEVLKRIKISCPNLGDDVSKHHVHVPLDRGRARRCQIYPREFSKRICEGIAAEKKLRKLGMVALPILSLSSDMNDGKKACDALHEPDGTQAADDQSGEPLVPDLVRKATMEEMAYFRDTRVYEKVDLSECLSATGKKPIAGR